MAQHPSGGAAGMLHSISDNTSNFDEVLASLQQLQLLRGNPCAPISLGAGLDTSGLMTNLLSSSPMGSSSMAAPGLPATWSVDFPSIAQAPQYNTAEDLQAFSSMGLASERPNLAPQGIGMSHGLDVPGYDLNQSSSINHTLLLALTAEGNAQALSSSSSSCSSQGQPDAFMSFNPAASTLDFTPHAPLGAGHLSLAAMRQPPPPPGRPCGHGRSAQQSPVHRRQGAPGSSPNSPKFRPYHPSRLGDPKHNSTWRGHVATRFEPQKQVQSPGTVQPVAQGIGGSSASPLDNARLAAGSIASTSQHCAMRQSAVHAASSSTGPRAFPACQAPAVQDSPAPAGGPALVASSSQPAASGTAQLPPDDAVAEKMLAALAHVSEHLSHLLKAVDAVTVLCRNNIRKS